MLYRQGFDTFIRIFDEVGYIVSKKDFTDRVTDSSGAIFLSVLTREARNFDDIVADISGYFSDVDETQLKRDVKQFYAILERDGFIVSGKTEKEIDRKDKRFSYSAIMPKTIKSDFTPLFNRATKKTQIILEDRFKDEPHLMAFQIELTSRCNERCVHCYIPHQNKTTDISDDIFYYTLDQYRKMGGLNLTLSGGEPLMHPHFCEYLHKAKEYDFAVNVLSNLTLLNDDIVEIMKNIRLSSVQVSLYSMLPEIHDSITTIPGSFKKTLHSIETLVKNDIPLQISCPILKQNKNNYVDVLKYAKRIRVRAVTDYIIMARYDQTTDNLENRLNLDDIAKVISNNIENDFIYQMRIRSTNFNVADNIDKSNDIVCGVCISSLGMVANGNIYSCAGWQSCILGNILEQPLNEIWLNSPKVKYLRSLRKKDFPQCSGCPDKSFCAMCMVRNANENIEGDPLKINEHFCKVANINRKIVMEYKKKKTPKIFWKLAGIDNSGKQI
jgi:radical SAM protein with 4Fe4S-binding SPASM domain